MRRGQHLLSVVGASSCRRSRTAEHGVDVFHRRIPTQFPPRGSDLPVEDPKKPRPHSGSALEPGCGLDESTEGGLGDVLCELGVQPGTPCRAEDLREVRADHFLDCLRVVRADPGGEIWGIGSATTPSVTPCHISYYALDR